MKKLLLLLTLTTIIFVNAQNKTCDSPDKESLLEDLNSITKCSIEKTKKSDNKKTRQIRVKVSAKKRYLINRTENNSLAHKESEITRINKIKLAKHKLLAITKSISLEKLKKAEKFSTVDEIPSFEKCTSLKGDDKLDCFNQEMIEHINKHFYYPVDAINKKVEGKIWVRFIITENGDISNVKTLGNSNTKPLQEVAKHVVGNLPKFYPGTKNKKPIAVKYSFPIDFSLQE